MLHDTPVAEAIRHRRTEVFFEHMPASVIPDLQRAFFLIFPAKSQFSRKRGNEGYAAGVVGNQLRQFTVFIPRDIRRQLLKAVFLTDGSLHKDRLVQEMSCPCIIAYPRVHLAVGREESIRLYFIIGKVVLRSRQSSQIQQLPLRRDLIQRPRHRFLSRVPNVQQKQSIIGQPHKIRSILHFQLSHQSLIPIEPVLRFKVLTAVPILHRQQSAFRDAQRRTGRELFRSGTVQRVPPGIVFVIHTLLKVKAIVPIPQRSQACFGIEQRQRSCGGIKCHQVAFSVGNVPGGCEFPEYGTLRQRIRSVAAKIHPIPDTDIVPAVILHLNDSRSLMLRRPRQLLRWAVGRLRRVFPAAGGQHGGHEQKKSPNHQVVLFHPTFSPVKPREAK